MISFEPSFEGWREVARGYLSQNVAPQDISWTEPSLFETPHLQVANIDSKTFLVPADFILLAKSVACARDPERWNLLYRILYRLKNHNQNLLKITVDRDVLRANLLMKSVRRDIHKMHAFVRFKHTHAGGEDLYVAWHRPEHLIVKPATPFFVRRFGDKRWSIFTPEASAHWDLQELKFGPGLAQSEFHARDDWDEIWKTYYKSIFNPARIKIKAMKLEMAPKYWSSLPEAETIKDLVREAPQRLESMRSSQNQAAPVEMGLALAELNARARECTSCPLFRTATQTVVGAGPEKAEIMIVGEQPGDSEDLTGVPFSGPSGEVLDRALSIAGISRAEIYITNAVKHFKFTRQGKIRIHQKPSGAEMHACKPWLDAEIARIKPKIIVALGTTAATVVLGRLPKIKDERGRMYHNPKTGGQTMVSWHPAAILRAGNDAEALIRANELAADLKLTREWIEAAHLK
jgi:probable DNA metabolism protein